MWQPTGAMSGSSYYWRLQIKGPDGSVVYDNSTYLFGSMSSVPQPLPSAYIQTGWLGGFVRTNGQQVTRQLFDTSSNAGSDEIEFGPNISMTDLSFVRSGNDLVIRYGGSTTSQIMIRGHYTASGAVETLKFADGQSVSLTSLLQATSNGQVDGTSGADLMLGRWGAFADTLAGGDGNDVLVGYDGADILSGGNGDDVLEGGAGADRLDGGADAVGGIGDTARYVRSGAAVSVDLNLATAQTGGDAAGDVLLGIENVTGSAFADTLTGDGSDNRLIGIDGDDLVRGGAGRDALVGDSGNDTLYGDAGDDEIAGGDGADQAWGGDGNDTIDGGEGNDRIFGDAGNDQLLGKDGDDLLEGGVGNDVLSGGAGADQLIGGAGSDTLSGDEGNDTLSGGAGDDVYLVSLASGNDTIIDAEGSNSLVLQGALSLSELWLVRSGNDLKVSAIGGSSALTIRDFYATTSPTRLRTISTSTHTLYLGYAAPFISAMTAAGAETPPSMSASIKALLATYWHEGHKAVPSASAIALTIQEDTPTPLTGTGAVDHDENIVGYRLGRAPLLGSVVINSMTGMFTYQPNADANGSDSFSVIVTDADGLASEIPVNLTIVPVNDAPRNLAVAVGDTLSVFESAPGSRTTSGTPIAGFTALDVEGEPITWSLADNAGGRFVITGGGQLYVLTPALLDREVAASHVIRVTATDVFGAATTSTFTVEVANVNEAPTIPVLVRARGLVSENVVGVNAVNNGALVAEFTASDPDGPPAPGIVFSPDASGNPGGRFKIVGNQVVFAVEPDFEALVNAGFAISDSDSDGLGEVTLTGKVMASDGLLLSEGSTSFSIQVEDVNQQHTAISLGAAVTRINELDRLAAGSARPTIVLGTLAVTDPDLPGRLTGQHNFAVYEGSSSRISSRFAVDANRRLTLLANQSLDFETDGATITLRIRATDRTASPFTLDRNFSFTIVDQDDVQDGTASADVLTGQQNRDILRGYGGNDTLSGGDGNDRLQGGDGDDLLNGGLGSDELLGDAGNDILNGDSGNDTLYGGDGYDLLSGGAGNDSLYGDQGSDGIRAAGEDTWRGFTAIGLNGGDGDDYLDGGDGDDYLDGGLGADRLVGGAGFDGVDYSRSIAGVTVNLTSGTGVGGCAQGDSWSGIELVQGSEFADVITSSSGNDVLYGGGGDDVLRGGAGDDYLLGGAGDDTLDAEKGDDYLSGGAGNDLLIGGADNDVYFIGRNHGNDRIRNFDSTGTNFDQVAFDGSILYTDIWFERVDEAGSVSPGGAHLKMTILGATGADGSVLVENWYSSPEYGLPDSYFKIDLISDGSDRAALPVNVDALAALMAAVPVGSRPTTQAQMNALRSSDQAFKNAIEDYWGRLSPPKISDTAAISGSEALDNGTATVSFAVRAWFEDDQNLGLAIPASQIDLTLSTSDGSVLASYVSSVDYGIPDSNGNRTVTLTLQPNASTHLLPGGVLNLQLQARIRGTTRTTLDPGGIALTITPTADTSFFTQIASNGGAAGSAVPLVVRAGSVDVDGSERVDVLIRNFPAGYSLVNGAGAAVGIWDSANGAWRFSSADLVDLRLRVPAGRFEDAAMLIAAQSVDGTSSQTLSWQTFNVVVHGTPTNVVLAGSVVENAAYGNIVGTLTGIDPDTAEGAPTPTSFQLINDAGGRYKLDPNAPNRLLVNNGRANINFESASRDLENSIVVRVTDNTGLWKDVSIVVPVADVNEQPDAPGGGSAPQAIFNEVGATDRPAARDAVVATLALSDPDRNSSLSLRWATNGNPGNLFKIVGNQVLINADLNYEELAPVYGSSPENGNLELAVKFTLRIEAWDGQLASSPTEIKVYVSNVNEQPNPPLLLSSVLHSETLSGDRPHMGQEIARFGLSDPDGLPPSLVILSGNDYGWFGITNGNVLSFNSADFTARWLRATKGQLGQDPDFYFDVDGDGLKEIRVASLVLAAEDAKGTRSAPFTYNVLIEDKNEAPVWTPIPLLQVQEDRRYGFHVWTAAAPDPDGPPSATFYVFAGGRLFYDPQMNMHFSASSDERFMVNTWDGRIFVGPRADFDFESGNKSFSYDIIATDRYMGTYSLSSWTNVRFNVTDLNEPHTLSNASFSINEQNGAPNTPSYDLRPNMLWDPEGRNMTWTFADGSNRSGIWSLTSDGILSLTTGSVDYEALTTRYETRSYFDYSIYAWVSYEVAIRDSSLATQPLSIKAYDGQHERTATVFATVRDVNEAPAISSWKTYYGSDGSVIYRSNTEYWVTADKNGGSIIQISQIDPEGQTLGFSYSITNQSAVESYYSSGGSKEIDATGYPYVWIDGSGVISFSTPGEGNGGEWEGGLKIDGWRRTSSVTVTFTLTVTDPGGASTSTPFSVVFVRRGSSVPPIVLDLDGDGVELVPFDGSSVTFDMDLDGVRDRTGWAAADDGLLALDRNANGVIDDISEISFASDAEGAITDGEGLRAFDSNNDGILSAEDERFGEFLAWQDKNQNGISEAGELRTLTEAGIAFINLTLNPTGEGVIGSDNTVFANMNVGWKDGKETNAGDVFFAFDPSNVEASLAAPIVFDLDHDGAGLVSLEASKTRFDMNGDGIADQAGWIEEGDALLALDRNDNGIIDNISEISFVNDKPGAKTDLEGLTAFDADGNGVLDGNDERFVEFKLWRDANANGVTDAGELLSLAEAGIAAINLNGDPTNAEAIAGQNIIYNRSTYTLSSQASGTLLDVGLAYKALKALPETKFVQSSWNGASRDWQLAASGGQLVVRSRRAQGLTNDAAGAVGSASILSFDGRLVGVLCTILLDLDNDGLEVRKASKSRASFDMNADGVMDDTGWMSGGDAMLVIDRDGDGAITDASELSFLSEKADAASAWDGLGALDNTKDGKITSADARFGQLLVWQDTNENGISEAGELKSLTELGITEIALRQSNTQDRGKMGHNVVLSTATFKRSNGVTSTIANAALSFDASAATADNPGDTSSNQAAARLAEAMSAFGADGTGNDFSLGFAEGKTSADWLTAAAA